MEIKTEIYATEVNALNEKLKHDSIQDIYDSQSVDSLILAAALGNYDHVAKMISGSSSRFKQVALMLAAEKGHNNIVALFLQNRVDVNARDKSGTPLIFAAENGHDQVVDLLLKNGADVNARDNNGKNALIYAARNGYDQVVNLLLEQGAEVDDRSLYYAKKALMERNRTSWPVTLTKLFVFASSTALVCLFAADIVLPGFSLGMQLLASTVLVATIGLVGHYAYYSLWDNSQQKLEQIKNRLSQKYVEQMDVNAKDDFGRTALINAAQNGDYYRVVLLLERAADVSATDNYGKNALIYAAENGHDQVVNLLLKNRADVKATDDDGKNVLIYAAENGYDQVVNLLLKNEADVNAKDTHGTPLIFAAKNGHDSTVALLLKNEADVNATDDFGGTALMMAAKYGHDQVVNLLLKNEAAVNAKNDYGTTALIYAAENAHDSTVALLLQYGADVKAQSKDNKTTLDYVQFLIKSAKDESNYDLIYDSYYIQRLEKIERLLIAAESQNRFTLSQLLGGITVVAVGTAIVFLFAVDMVLPGFSLGIQLCASAGLVMITGLTATTGYHSLYGSINTSVAGGEEDSLKSNRLGQKGGEEEFTLLSRSNSCSSIIRDGSFDNYYEC